jgi:hypothetical protein
MKKREIEQLQRDLSDYKRWYEAEKIKTEKLEQVNTELSRDLTYMFDRHNNEIKNLREIIRWQINPQTAKHPFMAMNDNGEPERYMI